jgi:hypothetical protein
MNRITSQVLPIGVNLWVTRMNRVTSQVLPLEVNLWVTRMNWVTSQVTTCSGFISGVHPGFFLGVRRKLPLATAYMRLRVK